MCSLIVLSSHYVTISTQNFVETYTVVYLLYWGCVSVFIAVYDTDKIIYDRPESSVGFFGVMGISVFNCEKY